MTSLIELLRLCRKTKTLHVRLRFAEEIVFRVGPALLSFIRRRTRPAFVEDAYQETLMAIAIGLERCEARTEPEFWKWCYGTARHKIADQWRRENRGDTATLDIEETRQALEASLKVQSVPAARLADLNYAMELLQASKAPCVGYLWDRFGLDLDYKDLGATHGLSEDAMRMQVQRCLELVQKLLSQKEKVARV